MPGRPEEDARTRTATKPFQIGLVGARPDRRANKAAKGRFEKAGVAPMRTLMEVKADKGDELKPGDKVLCDTFKEQDHVDMIGTSKGKGFMGVVARHGFRGGAATHGSMFHRAPGSIGPSAFPRASIRAPGPRAGWEVASRRPRTSIVVRVDAEKNLIYLSGPVPGARNAIIKIVRSSFARKAKKA